MADYEAIKTAIDINLKEQQMYSDDDYESDYDYYCLIFTHHYRNPAALAILTARRPKSEGEHGIYNADVFGTTIEYKNNVIKAYAPDDEELKTE